MVVVLCEVEFEYLCYVVGEEFVVMVDYYDVVMEFVYECF